MSNLQQLLHMVLNVLVFAVVVLLVQGLSAIASTQVEHRHAAGTQGERREFVRLPHPTLADAFEHDDQHMLHQVRSSLLVAQVAKSVQPQTRRQATAKLGFRVRGVRRDDPLYQFRIGCVRQVHDLGL